MCNIYAAADEILELVKGTNITLFWDVIPCNLV
jgi:hypothetical protein